MLVGEEVAEHGTAGRLVRVHADIAGERGTGGNAVLGQHALDLPVRRTVALLAHLLPHRQLARAVGGHGERLQRGEVDPVLAVGVQQLRRDVAEAEPLLDRALGDAEVGGDVGDRGAGHRQGAEGLDLVGRMHRHPNHILGQGDLAVVGTIGDDAAGDGIVGLDDALACELVERGEAPGAGDDGEALAAVLGGRSRTRDEVLEQAVDGDGCLELVEGDLAGGRLAEVRGRGLEPVERDGSDDGFGHRLLRRWGRDWAACGWDGRPGATARI